MTRARRLLVGAVGAALAVTGCADVPDSGPVSRVGAADTSEDLGTVFEPSGPRPGASPVEIVQGFYEAMLVNPVSTEGAQEFLTEQARQDWRPGRRTVIYQEDVRPRQREPWVVEVPIDEFGTLDGRGHYTPSPPAQTVETSRLRLRKVGGQWRIANPTDALYISDYFFERYYDPFSLYFLGPSGDTMVPAPIYLPTDLQPATALVRGLLKGPPRSWRGQLGTAVPSSTELKGSVPITDDAVAEVRLEGRIFDLSAQDQRLLSAQLVLTLAQLAQDGPVPELEGVRIFANGAPLTIPGVPAVQGLDMWSNLDPALLSTRDRLYTLRSGRIVEVDGRRVSEPLKGSVWSTGRQGIRSFDVDVRLNQVVAVSADGTRLLSGPLYDSAGQSQRTLYSGGQDLSTPVATPVWTMRQEWLVVDRSASGTSRLLVVDGNQVRETPMGGLEQYRVEALSLSPDGMRYVALARPTTSDGFGASQIMTGRVSRSPADAHVVGLVEPRALVVSGSTLEDILSVGWSDATTLAVLGRRDSGPEGGRLGLESLTVRIDGSELAAAWLLPESVHPTRLLTPVGTDGLAYLTDPRGRLWVIDGGEWVQTTARRPSPTGGDEWVRAKVAGLRAPNFAG